ncbi:MAG: alanine:cation symporter family protein, partial [Oscillospiraceae bacterium]|nr:alanine:cation symporter family protein [Oscillospiraceae bacterium]
DPSADGAQFAINAFAAALGKKAGIAAALMIALFALASVCGWYIYGILSLKRLIPKSENALRLYRILYALFAGAGVFLQVKTIWLVSDILTGLMLMINLCGVIMLFLFSKTSVS